MKIAYIYDTKVQKQKKTGAHHVNHLIVSELRNLGISVKNYYPSTTLAETIVRFKGLRNILFFNSLLEQKNDLLKADIIQGTTYTPIALLGKGTPVVTHFGSTTQGFMESVPLTHNLENESKAILHELYDAGVLKELRLKTRRPMRDIAEVELYTAMNADLVIATSEKVKAELVSYGIAAERIRVVHNGVDNYWLDKPLARLAPLQLVFLGRIGNDVFNWKLKGVDRLIAIYRACKHLPKLTIAMTDNQAFGPWLSATMKHHTLLLNQPKETICEVLRPLRGSIVLLTSRYEGFSLSLIEAMSQGLIPITFNVGIAPEIITQGKNGYIVKDIAEAKQYIRKIAADDSLRRALSLSAAQTAQQFRAETLAKNLRDLYLDILQPAEKVTPLTFVHETIESTKQVTEKLKNVLVLATHATESTVPAESE